MELLEQERAKQTTALAPTSAPTAEKPKRDTKRGTRLTIKTLPDEWRAWMAKNFPQYDPDPVFSAFHDYWIGVSGANGVKLDWFATFRIHVRGIPEWKQKNFIKKDCEQETLPNSNISPMFEYSPGLKGKLEEGKDGRGTAKKSSTTIRMKHYSGGYLALVGANSPAGLASLRRHCKRFGLEVDLVPSGAAEFQLP